MIHRPFASPRISATPRALCERRGLLTRWNTHEQGRKCRKSSRHLVQLTTGCNWGRNIFSLLTLHAVVFLCIFSSRLLNFAAWSMQGVAFRQQDCSESGADRVTSLPFICQDHSFTKERIPADPHAPGSALPASSYAADIGYLVDGTPMNAAGNNAVHWGVSWWSLNLHGSKCWGCTPVSYLTGKKRIMLRSLIKTYYKMNEQACILGEFLDKACSLLQRLATLRQRCGNGGLLLHPPNRRSVAWVSKPGRWKLLNNVHCHPFIWPWIDHHRQPIVTYYNYNQFYPKFQSLAWHECDSNLNWSEHGFNLAYCHSVQVRGPYYSQVNLQLSNLEDLRRQSLKSILLVDLCKVLKGCVQHQDLHVKSSEKERLSAWLDILVHWMIIVHSSLFLSMFELNWAVLGAFQSNWPSFARLHCSLFDLRISL